MASFYEIVELSNGDVTLQRSDDDSGQPLVTIRFSEESLAFLGEAKFEVAKAMMEAGMDAAADLSDQDLEAQYDDLPEDVRHDENQAIEKSVLH